MNILTLCLYLLVFKDDVPSLNKSYRLLCSIPQHEIKLFGEIYPDPLQNIERGYLPTCHVFSGMWYSTCKFVFILGKTKCELSLCFLTRRGCIIVTSTWGVPTPQLCSATRRVGSAQSWGAVEAASSIRGLSVARLVVLAIRSSVCSLNLCLRNFSVR